MVGTKPLAGNQQAGREVRKYKGLSVGGAWRGRWLGCWYRDCESCWDVWDVGGCQGEQRRELVWRRLFSQPSTARQ